MTDTNTAPAENAPQESPLVETEAKAPVSANPALIDWPRDEWGFCTDLRADLIKAAREVRGNDVRLQVFLDTVKTGVQHALARLQGDKDALIADILREEARIAGMNANQRVAGYTL